MIKRLFLAVLLIAVTIGNMRSITAREVIDRIIKNTVGQPFPNTVDVFKEGNPNDEVTGIAVCMFATMDVMREAVKSGCNLIIVHEPLYYNHLDQTTQFNDNHVVKDKQKFIKENRLIIWRFHDYAHSIKPDGFLVGLAEKLEWKNFATSQVYDQYKLPATSLSDIITHLKGKFPGITLNVVGNPSAKISNVSFSPGAPGSMNHINCFTQKNADLVIGGEVPQWETYEYVRDAVAQGKNKAIIFLGHIPSENAGMEWCGNWIKKMVTEVPVKFFDSGLAYRSY